MADIRQYLDHLPFKACPHCRSNGFLKPHDVVYTLKQGRLNSVGRRIFCSNRYQHSGCGRTFRLYLSNVIPKLHYTGVQLMLFILLLLQQKPIATAYFRATGQYRSRNGYRWLNQLQRQCSAFRCCLAVCSVNTQAFAYRSNRLTMLLSTLLAMVSQVGINTCTCYQSQKQQGFI
ncbi:MAG: hypothetical protein HN395_05920 [Methylococcales bacterium]|mgnify:FL=1|nr:hypothetical protein [Methylococcales bacterium]